MHLERNDAAIVPARPPDASTKPSRRESSIAKIVSTSFAYRYAFSCIKKDALGHRC
jgi:hypothetical protein